MSWTLSDSGTKTPTLIGSCTISNTSPAVVTFTQNLAANDRVYFSTSGTLPTGLSPFTIYYVISTGLSGSSFEVSATLGGSAINTSSAGSGSHICWPIQAFAADTNNGTFVLEVDTSNMVQGDLVSLYVHTITLSGGATNQAWKGTYQHAQINNHKISPPIASDQSVTCSIQQAGGVAARAFPWKMLRI